ncbi:MAG: DUF4439 domain-containing protein, partial [Nocardioides sp.]
MTGESEAPQIESPQVESPQAEALQIEALQTALAAEHAAVYVYGALGGRTSRAETPELSAAVSSAYASHRARRDLLTSEVVDLGGEPVAAEAAYDVPGRLETPEQV